VPVLIGKAPFKFYRHLPCPLPSLRARLLSDAKAHLSDIFKELNLPGRFEVSSYRHLQALLNLLVKHLKLKVDVNQQPSYMPTLLDKYAWPGMSCR
jgi:hypothetical protein